MPKTEGLVKIMADNTSSNNKSFFPEFLDDYFAEVDEHLVAIRKNLLILETFVDKGNADKALLNGILRSYHTIKGLSGMVGQGEAEKIARYLETYMRALHDEKVRVSEEGMDQLARGTNILEQVIASKRSGKSAPPVGEFINAFKTATSPERGSSAEAFIPESEKTAEKKSSHIKDEDNNRLQAALKAGAKAWLFRFVPSQPLSDRGINVNTVRDKLQAVGDLISATPHIKPDGGIVFEFLVASHADESVFRSWRNGGLTWTLYEIAPQLSYLPQLPL